VSAKSAASTAIGVAQVAGPPSCPTCGSIEVVRFAHHDRSTPASFCLTCKRRIPTITADLRAHGWPDDVSRIKHHFLKPFGARRLSWIATDEGARALRTWAVGLRTREGLKKLMDREPEPEDFIVPGSDGKQLPN
jgi:hypothetical protein